MTGDDIIDRMHQILSDYDIYTPKRNRQCSIGYHGECTDQAGERCGCPCHKLAALVSEALSAARREGERGWIRCSERMPPIAGHYLTVDRYGTGQVVAEWRTDGVRGFYIGAHSFFATHWRELPALPGAADG